MKHVGDFDASAVIYGKFTTYRPSTGANFTLAGSPALSVYKDNSTTQSTSGVTLTADFDSVTGLNHFAIDTSADGTFYSAGSFFDIVITTGTVDSVSVVGSVVASFTIRKNSALKPATAGRTLVVDASGLADANVVKVGPTGSGTAQTARDIGASVLLSTGTGTGQLDFTSGVVKANVTQYGGSAGTFSSGRPEVNATSINGSATGAANLATAFNDTAGAQPWTGIVDQGTAQSATGTTLVLRSAAAFASSELVGAIIVITGGSTGVGQARAITAYNGGTDTATVDTWTTTPTGTITYKIFAAPPGPATAIDVNVTKWLGTTVSTPTVAGVPNVNAKTWNDLATVALPLVPTTAGRTLDVSIGGEAGVDWANVGSPTTTVGLSGTTVKTATDVETDTQDIQGRLPAALVSGRIDASVGAMAANVLTATAINADAITAAKVAADVSAEIADQVWDEALSGHATGGSAGAALSAATAPSAAAVADAVWDELIAGHAVSGSTGEALSAAGAAGDPWITALPGSYSAGQAGYIVGTNVNATISSRATQTSVDTVDDFLDTEIAAIKAKTDNLPADPADASDIAASLTTIAGYIDTEVAAIKAKTDLIPASPAAVGDIPTATENADALLNRDMSAVSDTNSRSPLNALRMLRNKWDNAGGTLTVKKENDSTTAWTATLATDAAADPITGIDPA